MSNKVTEFDFFLAWVLHFFAAMVGGAIVGLIGGAIMGIALLPFGIVGDRAAVAGSIVGFVLSLPVSYILFRLIVARFIVQKLLPNGQTKAEPRSQVPF